MLVSMMYHYIHAEGDDPIFQGLHGLSIEKFEQQLDLLCTQFSAVTHAQLLAWAQGEGELPERGFSLTFDDGFKQHHRNVLPVLLKFGLEGSFYIPTQPVTEKKLHLLEKQRLCQYGIFASYPEFLDAFYQIASAHADSTKHVQMEPSKKNVRATEDYLAQNNFYSNEERFYRFVRDELLSPDEFEAGISALFNQHFDESNVTERYYLNCQDIAELAGQGMHIGGHSHAHPHLNKLDASAAREEIAIGLKHLQAITRNPVESFSYPFGTYSATTIEQLKSLNITYAYTTQNCIYQNSYAPYEITRIDAASFKPEVLC